MATQLTKEQIEKISRGYEWYPDITFETFCDLNIFQTYSDDVRQLYNDIDKDYCVFIYETLIDNESNN
jgi:hypothetical protein